jgi:hypothetical protein
VTSVELQPSASTDSSFTYTLPAGSPVVVAALQPCWIEVRDSAESPVINETTLQSHQTVTLTSPVWIRFGDPTHVRVTTGSSPLRLPSLSGELIIVS